MRVSVVSRSMNFKSNKSSHVGYGVPQGADYSTIPAKVEGYTNQGRAQLQRQIRKGENVQDARQQVILSEMPKTLDYVSAYCPGGCSDDDLTQEALLSLVEAGARNNDDTLLGFERKVNRRVKRRINGVSKADSRDSKNCVSMNCLPDEAVSLGYCQRRFDSGKTEALNEFLDKTLRRQEREVIEGRFLTSDDEKKSYTQLSEELGIPVGQVRQIEERALKKLRNPATINALNDVTSDDFYIE